MNLYKKIVIAEKEVSEQLLELKNSIYNYLSDVSGCGNLISVEIVSNRAVCNPVITIKYERYSFLYLDYKMVFLPKYTEEIDFDIFKEVMDDIEYIINNVIVTPTKKEETK